MNVINCFQLYCTPVLPNQWAMELLKQGCEYFEMLQFSVI